MSQRVAQYLAVVIALVTMAMMVYVGLRIHIFRLSYKIDQEQRLLLGEKEQLRGLRYEVSKMKSLSALEEEGAFIRPPAYFKRYESRSIKSSMS